MSVVVAVVAVEVMQVVPDQVVGVVPVRHRLVAATRTVAMGRVMRPASMVRSAGVGIGLADFQYVLVHVVPVEEMQVSVVQVADVVAVADRGVAAFRGVQVIVFFVPMVRHFASETPAEPGLRTYRLAPRLTSPAWIPRPPGD